MSGNAGWPYDPRDVVEDEPPYDGPDYQSEQVPTRELKPGDWVMYWYDPGGVETGPEPLTQGVATVVELTSAEDGKYRVLLDTHDGLAPVWWPADELQERFIGEVLP